MSASSRPIWGSRTMLEVQGLKVHYGAVQALHGVNVSVAQGEIVTIIGANGAGKSTLLRTICGVLQPSAGRIAPTCLS